jgi:hypothetical protein
MLDHFEDAGLEILHDGVCPEARVMIQVSGKALMAGEVEQRVTVGE